VNQVKGKVFRLTIEDELKESYMNYAMSVIVSRALPDVRDGMKPVHRRILYAMGEMGLRSDRAYVKSGRIVGDVLGKYHPHGDQSIYEALVRLAQDFSLRYPVVDGQGNYGSLDGDPPAAMRYTEARLEKFAEEMLKDIKKETVDFGPNYDDSLEEPLVLPAAVPFLLVNGASGIAVGMATNLPPHNLKEVSDAVIALIDNTELSMSELMKYVKGPDFPTGGIIHGRQGIIDAYTTGRGKIFVRAKFTLDSTKSGKDIILINELPYQVNKANLVAKIADLVREKKINGISDLRDESGRDEQVRIVIELKRGIKPRVVLNQLFSHTSLQRNFNVNSLALVHGKPQLLDLRQMLVHFIDHRKEVVTRRTRFELRKAEERAHILKGLKIALENIDEVVSIIKKSQDPETARINLGKRFKLSEKQAQAILDMRLQRLTSLETKKIIEELNEVLARIAFFKDLLSDDRKILGVVKEETRAVSEKYSDERRTEIVNEEIEAFDIEDLIIKEDMVILVSHRGFIKRIAISAYRMQNRGGRGATSANVREDDFLEQVFIATTHEHLLFITNEGKAYWLKVHEIPVGSRVSRGQSIKALLNISSDEEISTVLSFKEFSEKSYVLMATCRGVVKKVTTSAFAHAKTRGVIAVKLDSGDKLVTAKLTEGDEEIILVTRKGYALRFHESSVRPTGRATRGVRGIRLRRDDELSGAMTLREGEGMLLVTERGLGKRVAFDSFLSHGRATGGQRCYGVSERTGELVGVMSVSRMDDLICITSQGHLLKIKVKDIPVQGKIAMGVKVVNITKPDTVVDIAKNAKEEQESEEG
jgi:DNA gyrase subunit A